MSNAKKNRWVNSLWSMVYGTVKNIRLSTIDYRQSTIFCSSLFVIYALLFVISPSFAKDITIIYTGDTHAMLYPCSCPIEQDGGVTRRATLIKELRKSNPETLVLDSGNFFAGGLMDEYTQNTQLDMQRTIVNLKALELMKYDALALGESEFNFGKEFFQSNMEKANLTVLSCNAKTDKVLPYIIKEVAGIKIGIIGTTNLAAKQKAGGIDFVDPKPVVTKAIAELKKSGANIIVLLSNLGENLDLNLINGIKDIDIVITGYGRAKEEPFTKVANTLVLRPSWQGRRLGKVTFSVRDNKVANYKVEEVRLSDKIADDPGILAILPRCFADRNCKKEGLIGTCQDPGSITSSCIFAEANKISLLIITPKSCITCNPEGVINFLEKQFPGLDVSYIYYPNKKADKLIKDFGIYGLPAYLLGKETEREKSFDSLKENLEFKGNYYMLKPRVSGISYFLDRQNVKGRIDLFVSLYDKDTDKILETVKEFNPTVHFLATMHDGKFSAAKGDVEIEEDLRSVCVQKYYPKLFWDYISCRAKNIESSWWDNCLSAVDTSKIKVCAQTEESRNLLKDNISLNKELQVMFGPSYLSDNQEIFATKGVPSKEEFKKILKR